MTVNFKNTDRKQEYLLHVGCLAVHKELIVQSHKDILIYMDTHLSHPVEYI